MEICGTYTGYNKMKML